MLSFVNLWWLALLALAVPLAWLMRNRRPTSSVVMPDFGEVMSERSRGGILSATLLLCRVGAVVLAVVALCGPRLAQLAGLNGTTQGRRIFIALDDSYSMGKAYEGKAPVRPPSEWLEEEESRDKDSEPMVKDKAPRRVDVGQAAAGKFIEMRIARKVGDQIGWIDFDGEPRLRLPLEATLAQGELISRFPPSGGGLGGLGPGTNFEKLIEFAAEQFLAVEKETGIRGSNVLIMITDGEDKLDAKVEERLVGVLKGARIHLHLIGVGPDLAKEDISIVRICKAAGGTVYRTEAGDMDVFFNTIDGVESSPIEVEGLPGHEQLFYIPLALSMLLCVVGMSLDALVKGN